MIAHTTIERIRTVLRESVERQEVAGCSLLLIKDGEEILYCEDGLADREANVPIRRDTLFRIYSMSKPVTAAAAMLLLERGIIDLQDPVSHYIPGFRNQQVAAGDKLVPAEREVTIKHLLSMTSGLVYEGTDRAGQDTLAVFREIDDRLFGVEPMSTMDVANRLGACALKFQPGQSYEYGTSADVMGAVIEAASGMRFGEFLRKELFEPLGMKDTGFWVPDEKRHRLAKTYAMNENGELELYTGNHLGIIHQMDRPPAFESGGAGLVSTIDDYAKFANMLMNGGSADGIRILQPGTVKFLVSPSLNAIQQQVFDEKHPHKVGYSYGNYMRVMTDPGRAVTLGSIGEYGWDGWLGTHFSNNPQERLILLLMMQRKDAGTTPLARKIRNIVFSSCQ
jgi:CubicO group peptidase (beta-lactamase class C family)